jgi:subtilisin family serine protease
MLVTLTPQPAHAAKQGTARKAGTARATTPAVPPAQPGTEPSWTITLVTGDVVRLVGNPGRQSASVVTDVAPEGDVSISQIGNDIYAVPGVAAPLLASDRLDLNLFDLSLLARGGFADQNATKLPLLVTYTSDAAAVRATTDRSLVGTTPRRHLSSARGLAVGVDRQASTRFWDSVTDPGVARAEGGNGNRRADQLAAKPEVRKIWLDGRVKASDDVSRAAIGADRAWAAGYDGAGSTVAILDTGIDDKHPDLAGQVADKQSFVAGTDTHDAFGHGTHVASIIAGTGVASGGKYAGVAPKTKLVIGKVLGDDGNGSWSDLIAGMEWAATKAKVINMSLGGGPSDGSDPASQALNDISKRTGALFVVAAGNAGPDRQSVGTPAAADLALAVGSVARDGGALAGYSSIGPRRADWSIKPEITAPGSDIVAARASGTTMGSPVDANYTAASGTSMATPHVAASAAILVQRHPGWTAQQIRDALTSTAKPTKDPIYWQGSGVTDIGKAVSQDVYATGILNLGVADFPQAPSTPLTGTITYSNSGTAAATLKLGVDLRQAPSDFGRSEQPWTPPAGAVSVSPAEVTVPAGGSVTTQVRVDVTQAPYGSMFGRLQATSPDGATVAATTVGFTRDVERHRLTMRVMDRDGVPVTTTGWSYGYLMDLDTGKPYFVGFDNGDAVVSGLGTNPRMPVGRYAFQAYLGGFGGAPNYPLKSWTAVAEPEIVLDRDRTFVFDARKAGRVDVRTQRESIGWDGDNWMERKAPGAYLAMRPGGGSGGYVSSTAEELYTLAGGRATTGTFRYLHYVHRLAPPIKLHVSGEHDGEHDGILADYPAIKYNDRESNLPPVQPRFAASTTSSLVDVGSGSDAEVARAGVAGKLAMVRPPATWDGVLDDLAQRIAGAGAAGIVVVPPADGSPRNSNTTNVNYSALSKVAAKPVAVVSYDDGVRLAKTVESGPAHVDLTGVYPSPYSYNLLLSQDQGLTNGAVHDIRDSQLARVTTRYHGDSPGEYYTVSLSPMVAGPDFRSSQEAVPGRTVRFEFFTPDVPFFEMRSNVDFKRGIPGEMIWSRSHPAGHDEHLDVGAGPWVPGDFQYGRAGDMFVFTQGRQLSTSIAGFTAPGPPNLMLDGVPGTTNETKVICDPPACVTGSDGLYKIVNDTLARIALRGGRYTELPLSPRTHTEWTVNVDLDEGPSPWSNWSQPAILADWSVNSGLDNVVPRDEYTVDVTPSYSQYYKGDHGRFTSQLWATYDDGATWTPVDEPRTTRLGKPARFTVEKTPTQTNGFVGYRVRMTDEAGNAIDQTVIRAARTTAAAPRP